MERKNFLILQVTILACLLLGSSASTEVLARDLRYDSVSIKDSYENPVPASSALAGEYARFIQQIKEREIEYVRSIHDVVEKEFADRLADIQKRIDEAKDFDALKKAIDDQKAINAEMVAREETLKQDAPKKFAEEIETKKKDILNKRIQQYKDARLHRDYQFHLCAYDKSKPGGSRYYCKIKNLDCVYPKGEWIYTNNIKSDCKGINCTEKLEGLSVIVINGKSTEPQPNPGSKDPKGPLNRDASGIRLYASLEGLGWKEGNRHADLTFRLSYRYEDSVIATRAQNDCNAFF